MILWQQTPFRLALSCLPLLALSGCPTDERGLAFGFAANNSDSSTTLGLPGVSGAPDGGVSAEMNAAGKAPAAGGNGSPGDEPSVIAGAPEQAGSSPVGDTGAGGNATTAGQAGSAGGTSQGGNAGSSGSGGNAGSAGPGSIDTGPCGDLDQNGVQDCDETVASNPRFDANIQPWLADFGVTQSWQGADARGKAGSGSLDLIYTTGGSTSGWALAAAGQCLPAWGEKSYEVGARAQVPTGQTGGHAELNLAIFGNDDCKASFLTAKSIASTNQVGNWQVLQGAVTMPPGTRSVLIRLGAAKPGMQPSLEVHFDDVLFREQK